MNIINITHYNMKAVRGIHTCYKVCLGPKANLIHMPFTPIELLQLKTQTDRSFVSSTLQICLHESLMHNSSLLV